MAYSLGVDVGTTFTAAAIARDGVIEVVSLGSHQVTEPTVVFADGKELVFGNAALLRGRAQPAGLAREFKRRLGDSVPLVLAGSPYSADRLVALYAKWVVDSVSEQIGERPQRVVMTHPANWTEFQLHLLTQSLDEVGLGSALFLSEPEAAAIDYSHVAQVRSGEIYAVYDLGGGTFDLALLRKEEEGFAQVGEAAGLERLGGIDFDEAVFRYVIDRLPADLVQSIRTDPDAGRALGQLRRACVETKEGLSSEVAVDIPVVLPELSTTVRLTRAEFEDMIRPSLDQSIELVRRTLDRAGVPASDISGILLVGGSSRIPRVAELVQEELGIATRIDAHPKLVVARGAARWAASPAARVVERPAGGGDPRRQRSRGLVAAGVLAAAALIAVGVVLATRGGGEEAAGTGTDPTTAPATSAPATTAPASTTTSGPVVPTFTIGQRVDLRESPDVPVGADTLAFDGDEFWLTAIGAQQLVHLNRSGEILGRIATGPGPSDVAFGEGALWVTGYNQHKVLRFDPVTGELTGEIPFNNGPSNVAVGGGSVWVTILDIGVARINPTTLEADLIPFEPPPSTDEVAALKDCYPSPACEALGGLFVADDAIWLTRRSMDVVVRLDPVTLTFVGSPIPVGDGPDPVAVVDDVMWVGDRTGGTLTRVDLTTNDTITEPVCEGPAELVVDGAFVWVVCELSGELALVDASTLEVVRAEAVGPRPVSILKLDQSLWIVLAESDEVVRVDLT